MNQSLKVLLVSLCPFTLFCIAQGQSRASMQSRQDAHVPVAQINAKARLLASDGTSGSKFGSTSSINSRGDVVVVGAPFQRSSPGGVYVFGKPTAGWANATETTQLLVPGMPNHEDFGYAVAISGDGNTIAASSINTGNGTVFVFSPTAGSWSNGGTLVAELTTSDSGAFMGGSVAISSDGQTIVAGAPSYNTSEGALYVYSKPSGGWSNMSTQTAKLTVAVPISSQVLGTSVAIGGNTIAAGAEGTNGATGGVYVFSKPASGWTDGTQTAELLASDGAFDDELGFSVGISGNTIVAGAPLHPYGSSQEQGALYVFVEPASGWVDAFQNAELTASNANQAASFGRSVAIDGSLIIGGAPGIYSGGSDTGEAYVYVRPKIGWVNSTETFDLIATASGLNGALGSSVSLTSTGPVVIAGSSYSAKGGVFVFEK